MNTTLEKLFQFHFFHTYLIHTSIYVLVTCRNIAYVYVFLDILNIKRYALHSAANDVNFYFYDLIYTIPKFVSYLFV